MIKFASVFMAASLVVGSAGVALAQSYTTPAAGASDPYEPHDRPDGTRSPAPAARANGGVGAQEVPFDSAQTRSGGPVDGNITQQGGGG